MVRKENIRLRGKSKIETFSRKENLFTFYFEENSFSGVRVAIFAAYHGTNEVPGGGFSRFIIYSM